MGFALKWLLSFPGGLNPVSCSSRNLRRRTILYRNFDQYFFYINQFKAPSNMNHLKWTILKTKPETWGKWKNPGRLFTMFFWHPRWLAGFLPTVLLFLSFLGCFFCKGRVVLQSPDLPPGLPLDLPKGQDPGKYGVPVLAQQGCRGRSTPILSGINSSTQ